jgi:hypothetical protein
MAYKAITGEMLIMARDWRRLALAAMGAAAFAVAAPTLAFAQAEAPPKKKAATAKQSQAKQAPAKPGEEGEQPAAKKKRQDPAEAQQAIDAALKQLEAGKTDAAVQALSTTLSAGNLPPGLMARALLYRGIGYRQQKKPALAIADLTSALWLKGGLNEMDRADALKQRTSAYQEAG